MTSQRTIKLDDSKSFQLISKFTPAGDQPKAIAALIDNISRGRKRQVLLGVTGSGKTFTIANVIEQLNRPALVLAHNKTLAAQLYSEFRELFPENAVRFFVSYYDYYQPEAYLPASDTYIEKDAAINDEIDKLRHAATRALLERRDVIVVASVSCIYGLGDPDAYFKMLLYLEVGDQIDRDDILLKLVELQYQRDELEFGRGSFRVRGDIIEICPASEVDRCVRIELFGSEVERISEFDKLTTQTVSQNNSVCIYPASHYVADQQTLDRAVVTIREELEDRLAVLAKEGKTHEHDRLEQRTLLDLELLAEMGFCPGIENYSRHLTNRKPGEAPPTLVDYFPTDALFFIDESHVTVSQLTGMYRGDRSRKQTLVDFGFRLPSAIDNRPLMFDEFYDKADTLVYVSATPGEFERKDSNNHVVEQVIRPTGLLDPEVVVKPAGNQVEDFLEEIEVVIERNERILATTLTKKMAERLSDYYRDLGLRVRYLHSEVKTLERVELIRGLQDGEFDILVGVNLLREGLDLPEVSLIGIFDADKEGFLRSSTSLIQTIGRAARNVRGRVVMYADKVTDSMRFALDETIRRRTIQQQYNIENDITPRSTVRSRQSALIEVANSVAKSPLLGDITLPNTLAEGKARLTSMRVEMFDYAKRYEFEKAATVRDAIEALERYIMGMNSDGD